MSSQNKFFDEHTATILISRHGLMTRVKNVVELQTEVHVVNTKNDVAGTFAVVWVDQNDRNGFHNLGLELIESEAEMWGVHFPETRDLEDEASTEAWLKCTRCRQKLLCRVPLTELEHLDHGVLVARHCDQCRSTTAWEFTVEETAAAQAGPEVAPIPSDILLSASDDVFERPAESAKTDRAGVNERGRIRAPLKLTIKVQREFYGSTVEDMCETINVSRNGAYFLTSQNYHVGEKVRVSLPYRKGSLNLPVLATVVRQDRSKGSFDNAVAVHMEESVFIPGLEDANEPVPAAGKKADQRSRSRVPLKFPIKVTRLVQHKLVEDITETINISRTGAYFRTSQNYNLGEIVQVIMPYKPGDVAVPVSARVVRQDHLKNCVQNGVALALGETARPAQVAPPQR